MIHLVLGGARSGKSQFAENWLQQRCDNLQYVATGQAHDEEMQARIAHHQAQRGTRWQLTEEPVELAAALQRLDQLQGGILVDCLTLWLSNCLATGCWEEQQNALLNTVPTLSSPVVLVSNEVGSGIVPLGPLNREFVDASGRLHQQLAAVAREVTLVIAGLPQALK
jgi:adenosylcobinamide kinase/adenosylcobinamide-phosphate guanylyltransferase